MQTQNENGNSPGLKHPTREDWMACLYGELHRPERTRFMAHLRDCADCRTEVNRWRNAMEALDDYRLPPRRPSAPTWTLPALKWGIAAALALGIGFGLGQAAVPAARIKASLKSEIRAELLADLQQVQQRQLDNYSKAGEAQRTEDNRLILATLAKVQGNLAADYLSLRKDVETMAVLTQDNFQQTREQMLSIAMLSQPDDKSMKQ